MTCIVALKNPEARTVLMGGDSRRGMNGGLVIQLPEEACKVFEFAGFVIGHTGAGRIRNLTSRLKIRFGSEGPTREFNLEQELLEVLIPAFKELARKGGYLHEKDGVADLEGEILVAFGNQVCVIGSDFSVTPVSSEFWAIGSGQRLALGSLASTVRLLPPADRVYRALEVASMFESTVAPPFIMKETTPIPLRLVAE